MKTVKKVWNFIAYTLIVIALILAFLLAGMRVFGYGIYAVQSQSMEPTLDLGSVVYVDERGLDVSQLKEGDVITYMLNEEKLATHRITQVIPSSPKYGGVEFKTKGDHPDSHEDYGTVLGVNVLGEVKFSIPYLGYLAAYIQEPPGLYVAISVGAILLLLIFLPDLIFESEEDKQKRLEKELEAMKAKLAATNGDSANAEDAAETANAEDPGQSEE